MASVCLYFHVHQPFRVKRYQIFDVGNDHNYFNDSSETDLNNQRVFARVAEKSYLPTNRILLSLLHRHPEFRISYSFSGVFLEQLVEFSPKLLESFQALVATGQVDVLSETFYHSLAYFYSLSEFESQVEMHKNIVKKIFDFTPSVFRNTELAYTNSLAVWAEKEGFKAILAEGWDDVLGWRSPNFVYRPTGTKKIKLLLKNYKMSDDIAFRFSEKGWKEWPLTSEKFAQWVSKINGNGEIVNLFMDYETFGEHQWADTGIFDFLEHLPTEILRNPDNGFVTTAEAVAKFKVHDEIDVPHILTWADTERDLSAWMGNAIQRSALESIYALEERIHNTKNKRLMTDWRRLQISDHFYYMCTKWFADGDVHKYFSPYESPYDAYISYMNVVKDMELRTKNIEKRKRKLSRKEKNKKNERISITYLG